MFIGDKGRVFVNRGGRICVRSGERVVAAKHGVKRWELGDRAGVRVDLEEMLATFRVWPKDGRAPSVATVDFGAA